MQALTWWRSVNKTSIKYLVHLGFSMLRNPPLSSKLGKDRFMNRAGLPSVMLFSSTVYGGSSKFWSREGALECVGGFFAQHSRGCHRWEISCHGFSSVAWTVAAKECLELPSTCLVISVPKGWCSVHFCSSIVVLSWTQRVRGTRILCRGKGGSLGRTPSLAELVLNDYSASAQWRFLEPLTWWQGRRCLKDVFNMESDDLLINSFTWFISSIFCRFDGIFIFPGDLKTCWLVGSSLQNVFRFPLYLILIFGLMFYSLFPLLRSACDL